MYSLFISNLFRVYFFGKCGKIVDVRLHMDHKGRFNGFGQVKFATAEAAIKVISVTLCSL